ncbi:MAG: hypothetical protein HGB00_01650 [Chlorobiaceae bacterium]|nr:hypothetical protein [Chlorobiaceae bacterium]
MKKGVKEAAPPHGVTRQWSWDGGSGAMIWQLMFLDSGNVLGIKRIPSQRSASLFCLQSETGMALCDDFVLKNADQPDSPVGEGWMIGLETTHGELALCHSYQPGSPEHLGIWAVDLSAGHMVWSRPELTFAANLGSSLLAYRTRVFAGFPDREYSLVDSMTGVDIEHMGNGHERPNRLRDSAESEQARQGILLPELVRSGLEPVESVSCGAYRAEGYHRMNVADGTWFSGLRIMMGELAVYDDVMASNAPMPLFNNILIKGSTLYYIKGDRELISVSMR